MLAQSEEATRARLKQQDMMQKQQQVTALMSQCSARLQHLLGVDAAGESAVSLHACMHAGAACHMCGMHARMQCM